LVLSEYVCIFAIVKQFSCGNRKDGHLFCVLQNSEITYRPHRSFQGGGVFLFKKQKTMKRTTTIDLKKALVKKT
jgi:hypothetical protein